MMTVLVPNTTPISPQVNPGGTYVTTHDPGSDWAAFTYSGTQQAAEPRVRINSNGGGGGAAYQATVTITLTAPSAKPGAIQRIQVGFVQSVSDSGVANYDFTNGNRTVTVATTATVDWLSAVTGPGATDEWPWYDQTVRWTPANNSDTSKTLTMTDSPQLSIPSKWNPNSSSPNKNKPLVTATETEPFDIMVGARTLDTDNDAHKSYFNESKSWWKVNNAWPVVPNVSIVTVGSGWNVPPSATSINVNVVPAVIAGNAPFMTWVPSP